MPTPTKKQIGAAGGIGAAIAAMLAIATPEIASHEGKRNSPYLDAIGVRTVCYGETRVPMRTYTDAECKAMLDRAVREFGEGVAKLSPGIESSPYEWAAHTSLAFNVGLGTYAKSSVRSQFNAGDRVEACRSIRKYKYAGGRVLMGLVNRREGKGERLGEYEICLVGAVPASLS